MGLYTQSYVRRLYRDSLFESCFGINLSSNARNETKRSLRSIKSRKFRLDFYLDSAVIDTFCNILSNTKGRLLGYPLNT